MKLLLLDGLQKQYRLYYFISISHKNIKDNIYEKNGFVERSKILPGYRSER